MKNLTALLLLVPVLASAAPGCLEFTVTHCGTGWQITGL